MASLKARAVPDEAASEITLIQPSTPPPEYSASSRPKQDGKAKESDIISINSHQTEDTLLGDLVDLDIDPAVLASSVDSLLTILKSSISTLSALQDGEDQELDGYEDTNTRVLGECVSLADKVEQLEQVVVKLIHEEPNSVCMSEAEHSPIDPTVYKWTSDCVVEVLGLQADVEKLLEQYNGNENAASDTESWADTLVSAGEEEDAVEVVTLHRHLESLRRFNKQLEDFLPIIVADVNEYATCSLQFPVAIPESSQAYANRERGTYHQHLELPPPASNVTASFRRALYSLKDDLKSCLLQLQDVLETTKPIHLVEPQLLELRNAIPLVFDAITEALTNNGSEWIESGLAGKLSWEEFRVLQSAKVTTKMHGIAYRARILGTALRAEGVAARTRYLSKGSEGDVPEKGILGILQEDVEPVCRDLKELAGMLKVRIEPKREGESAEGDGGESSRAEGTDELLDSWREDLPIHEKR